MYNYIFKTSGIYLGYIFNDYVFSRDGIYLGWIDNDLVWDKNGEFRGKIMEFSGHKYILKNQYTISPVPRISKSAPVPPAPPAPQANIVPIITPLGFVDSF